MNTESTICHHCGQYNPPNQKDCIICGKELQMVKKADEILISQDTIEKLTSDITVPSRVQVRKIKVDMVVLPFNPNLPGSVTVADGEVLLQGFPKSGGFGSTVYWATFIGGFLGALIGTVFFEDGAVICVFPGLIIGVLVGLYFDRNKISIPIDGISKLKVVIRKTPLLRSQRVVIQFSHPSLQGDSTLSSNFELIKTEHFATFLAALGKEYQLNKLPLADLETRETINQLIN